MSDFVLVHGAWHGGWCWGRMTPFLEARGHRVYTPDLPGHGNDDTPFDEICLASYVSTVEKALAACQDPPILVAHSLAGIVVSALPATALASLASVVCVAAYIPGYGQSVTDMAQQDGPSLTRRHCFISQDQLELLLPQTVVSNAIYSDCPSETVAWALSQLKPEPLLPNTEPVTYDRGVLDKITKYYIECEQDRAVSVGLQRQMQGELEFTRIFNLASGHVPMISCPQELANTLLEIAVA